MTYRGKNISKALKYYAKWPNGHYELTKFLENKKITYDDINDAKLTPWQLKNTLLILIKSNVTLNISMEEIKLLAFPLIARYGKEAEDLLILYKANFKANGNVHKHFKNKLKKQLLEGKTEITEKLINTISSTYQDTEAFQILICLLKNQYTDDHHHNETDRVRPEYLATTEIANTERATNDYLYCGNCQHNLEYEHVLKGTCPRCRQPIYITLLNVSEVKEAIEAKTNYEIALKEIHNKAIQRITEMSMKERLEAGTQLELSKNQYTWKLRSKSRTTSRILDKMIENISAPIEFISEMILEEGE